MFGLSDHVGRREIGPRRFIGDDHDLARPGDRVDVHVAEDKLLRQRDELIARPDDLIDLREQRRHRPSTPYASAATACAPPIRYTSRMPSSWQVASTSWLYAPFGVGGETTTICLTPAACAGTAVISTVDGYAAAPPGTQIPTRSSGRYRCRNCSRAACSLRTSRCRIAVWNRKMLSRMRRIVSRELRVGLAHVRPPGLRRHAQRRRP